MKKRKQVFIKRNTSKTNETLKSSSRSSKKTKKNHISLLGWIARSPRAESSGYRLIPFSEDHLPPIFVESGEIKKPPPRLHTIVRANVYASREDAPTIRREDAPNMRRGDSPAHSRDDRGANRKKSRGQDRGYQRERGMTAIITEADLNIDDPNLETEILAQELGFPIEFDDQIIKDANALEYRHTAKRTDLRSDFFVTIDGETAKDFDDAIFVQKQDSGYVLKVAIADVSNFVRSKTDLDDEARYRGTSIYLPDRAIPMLPEKLSNDLCSLRPQEDRAVLCCEMHFDDSGARKSTAIFAATIKSRSRLTYTEVWNFLGPEKKRHPNPKIDPMLRQANDLFEILESLRVKRGSLNLDIPELDFEVNSFGDPVRVFFSQRNPAHRLIETFMIAANEAVAEFLAERDLPCLYRIHEKPDPLKIERLTKLFEKMQLPIQFPKTLTPLAFQKLLNDLNKEEDAKFFHSLILRSMKQAQYSPSNQGHFGLASESYCHFTSPIRRYPDLFVHRVLTESAFGTLEVAAKKGWLEELAEDCNTSEQRANKAEREMEDIKETRWLEKHLGEKFRARVVSIKEFGFFIRLEEPPIEGMVPLRLLPPDDWRVDELETELRGRRPDRKIRLGDQIEVQAVGVDRIKRNRDFRYLKHLTDKR